MKKLSFVIISLLFTAVVCGAVYYFTSGYYQGQINSIHLQSNKKIDSVEHQLQAILKITDTASIKSSFEQIDSSLSRINKSLASRGLGVVKTRQMSVGERFAQNTLADFAKYYELLTADLESRLLYTPFGMPYNGPQSSGFGLRRDPIMTDSVVSHLGVDFVGKHGDSVIATADGVVRFAGANGGYGNCIIITHANNFETLYGHLSKILIKEGIAVQAGDYIGLIGSTGKSTGPHLHYEVMRNSVKINPQQFLKL